MRGARSILSRFWRQQSGASAVEFALVLPILTLLLAGAVDIGGLAWTKLQVGAAARAGASYALTKGYSSVAVSSAMTSATNLTVSVAINENTVGCLDASTKVVTVQAINTACTSGAAAGSYVKVGASANYSPMMPWPGLPDPVALSSVAIVRIQ